MLLLLTHGRACLIFQCLNKKYAELLDDHIHEQERNKGVIGDDFKEEKTGKDDYANARNKVPSCAAL